MIDINLIKTVLIENSDRVISEFNTKWKECRLEEIATVQTGPFGSQLHMSDYKISELL